MQNVSHEHEALVAQFLQQRRSEMPTYYAEVCERHPVLSSRQMTTRAKREISISQLHGSRLRARADDIFYASSEAFDVDDGTAA